MNFPVPPVNPVLSAKDQQQTGIRVACLTGLVAPYWKPVFESLAHRYRIRIFLSTRMEAHRPWEVDWSGLDVVLQRTITLRRTWKHPSGFVEPIYVHLPIDTIFQLRRFRPRVLLSNEMGLRTLLACIYRKFSRTSRLLVIAEIADTTEHGRGRVRQIIRRLIKGQADDFLVLGQAGARYIRSLGVPPTKISKIGYTTDLSKFCRFPLMRSEENAYRILYVGQLVDRKGLLPFLRTLARWSADHAERSVDMVIVGDGPCDHDLKKVDVPANLTVTFHGNMAFSDLPGIYSKCGLFAFPTVADTWGVVVNEAMAAGLPVLGSVYSQAVEEMLEDGRNGWLFRPDDAEAVYAAIGKAMNASIDSLNRMRHFARQTAMLYSPEAMARKISEAVERVLSNN